MLMECCLDDRYFAKPQGVTVKATRCTRATSGQRTTTQPQLGPTQPNQRPFVQFISQLLVQLDAVVGSLGDIILDDDFQLLLRNFTNKYC
ncbi:hypothetical protein TREES_T100011860 [Tupaia chinensis]|uniref:Uncharacterized protein n=1 Tax=Tupaia chinensis TaxID=246437 RepID=L9KXJ9_TUPCH|nr:hypothetical protein TREES_T100011860 [Tupaia chinensis]